MLNLNVPIENPFNLSRITKIEVVDVADKRKKVPPCLNIQIDIWGPNNIFGGRKTLCALDAEPSTCLFKTAVPTSEKDLVRLDIVIIAGLYTRLVDVWNANVTAPRTTAKRLKAVEDDLVASGILSADFAGT